MRPTLAAAALALALDQPALAASPRDPMATFSIDARDPATGELGVAVGDLAALKGDAAFERLVGVRTNPPTSR